MYERIVVTVDGSAHGERAFESALEMARIGEGQLVLLSVVPFHLLYAGSPIPTPPITPAAVEAHRALLAGLQDRAKAAGVPRVTTELREGIVVDEILSYLEESPPDLVVVGSRGLSATQRLFLGSVSEAVVHLARCPVLVVKPKGSPKKAPKGA